MVLARPAVVSIEERYRLFREALETIMLVAGGGYDRLNVIGAWACVRIYAANPGIR